MTPRCPQIYPISRVKGLSIGYLDPKADPFWPPPDPNLTQNRSKLVQNRPIWSGSGPNSVPYFITNSLQIVTNTKSGVPDPKIDPFGTPFWRYLASRIPVLEGLKGSQLGIWYPIWTGFGTPGPRSDPDLTHFGPK